MKKAKPKAKKMAKRVPIEKPKEVITQWAKINPYTLDLEGLLSGERETKSQAKRVALGAFSEVVRVTIERF